MNEKAGKNTVVNSKKTLRKFLVSLEKGVEIISRKAKTKMYSKSKDETKNKTKNKKLPRRRQS